MRSGNGTENLLRGRRTNANLGPRLSALARSRRPPHARRGARLPDKPASSVCDGSQCSLLRALSCKRGQCCGSDASHGGPTGKGLPICAPSRGFGCRVSDRHRVSPVGFPSGMHPWQLLPVVSTHIGKQLLPEPVKRPVCQQTPDASAHFGSLLPWASWQTYPASFPTGETSVNPSTRPFPLTGKCSHRECAAMGHPGRRTNGSNSLARALTWGFRCRDSGLDALPATTGLLARERCDVVPEGIALPLTTGTPLTPARRDSHSPFYDPEYPSCQRQRGAPRLPSRERSVRKRDDCWSQYRADEREPP